MMNCELLAACSALGYLEEEKYFKEPDCLDTIKCLIHYLQQEDNSCTIRIQLNAAHIVVNDLIPILVQYHKENDLFNAVLRLLVNMTKPVTLCLGNLVPSDINTHYQFMSLLSANQDQKDAFSDSAIWSILAQKVYNILEKSWEDRTREDNKCLEAILVLVRNLLYTPGTPDDETKTADDISAHDKLIIAMHIAGFDNLIAYIAGTQKERNWCLHILEIISLMVKEHESESIAKVKVKSTVEDRKKMGDELMQLRAKESKHKSTFKLDSRHSRFGSTFVAKGITALKEDQNLILHKSVKKSSNYHFDEGKIKLTKAKNRRPLIDTSVKRHSTLAVRKVMYEFCVEFLESSYNTVMKNAIAMISAEKNDEHDESYFFWVMNFFMEFNRRNGCKVELVSETIQLSYLHFINVSIINYYEMMVTSKDYKTWGRRVHLAFRCYLELLLTIQQMKLSEDKNVAESAEVIMNTLFYIVEYRDIFLLILRKFDERKQTRSFLKDVIKATHLFIKLFQGHCGDSSIVVEKSVTVKKRKSKNNNHENNVKWEDIESDVIIAFAESTDRAEDHYSYLDNESSDLNTVAISKVHEYLINKNAIAAVKLLQEIQENHSNLEYFLSDGTVEDNVRILKTIFLDNSGERQIEEQPNPKRVKKEIQFTFDEYIKKMADVKIVSAYLTLFHEYQRNSPQINHYVVTMLHRIAFDFQLYGLMFNAAAFRTIQKLLAEKDSSTKELQKFGLFVVEQFFENLTSNNKLIVEILFKKNNLAEVTEMTEGYGTYAAKGTTAKWSEQEKAELTQLFHKFNESEENVVHAILANITDERKTRKQICNQLVDLGLVDDISSLKVKQGKIKIWRQSNIDELVRLFEEFKDSDDTVGKIKAHLTKSRSRESIIEKLLSLNLVASRRELYKKRPTARSKSQKETAVVHIGGDDSSNEDENDLDSNMPIEDQVKELQDMGYSNLIEWLCENLQQALEDRQEGDGDSEMLQPIPLVAFTKDQETGLTSASFKKLLSALQIQRPSDQEMFWRIPVSLTETDLQNNLNALTTSNKRKRSENFDSDENTSKIQRNDDN